MIGPNRVNYSEVPKILEPGWLHLPRHHEAALRIGATDYKIAVGYAFDSGLELIAPALMSTRFNGEKTTFPEDKKAELVIGSLKSYNGKNHVKQMSRATAENINNLLTSACVRNLYTCTNRFYHGKFYYIRSDNESFVITGSSNITRPAYENNYELDLIYHFTHPNGIMGDLEKEFIDWFDTLISSCEPIVQLDESLFPPSLAQDESGYTPKSSFFRSLKSEEEKERYELLESFEPSKIIEYAFQSRPFKAFRKYVLFEYAGRGISFLEGFSYGNSCYVIAMTKEAEIKDQLAWCSKDHVRSADYYITDIQHDANYAAEIAAVFQKFPNTK